MRPKGNASLIADRRKRSLQLLDKGLSLNAVARQIGCNASSVMRWRDQRKREGDGVYAVRTSPGRPRRLSAAHKRKLTKLLLKGAGTQGYGTDLWTTARIAEAIEKHFGVRYHRDHIGRVMADMGWSCQKPTRRALERDEAAITRWKRKEWPRVKKTPHGWAPTLSS